MAEIITEEGKKEVICFLEADHHIFDNRMAGKSIPALFENVKKIWEKYYTYSYGKLLDIVKDGDYVTLKSEKREDVELEINYLYI